MHNHTKSLTQYLAPSNQKVVSCQEWGLGTRLIKRLKVTIIDHAWSRDLGASDRSECLVSCPARARLLPVRGWGLGTGLLNAKVRDLLHGTRCSSRCSQQQAWPWLCQLRMHWSDWETWTGSYLVKSDADG